MTSTTPSATSQPSELLDTGNGVAIEYQWIAPERKEKDLVVFLHEGLGSVALWKDWPAQVCEAAGCRGLVFSRYGYGYSTLRPPDQKRGMDYIEVEAREDLPAFFSALGLTNERPILFGHSDGGSIALLYAAIYPERVKGIAVAAPHIFVEDITLDGIRAAREAYSTTDLGRKLGRYHRDPDSVFWHWNDTWLKPEFRHWNIESYLEDIRCPVLAIQGEGDEYGSLEQIRGIRRHAPHTELCVIPDCGHTPQRDHPELMVQTLARFINGL